MQHRPARSLAVGGIALACAAALGITTASTASAVSGSASGKKPQRLTAKALSASELSAAAGGARTASARIAAAYGGYPLYSSIATRKVVAPLQLSVSKKYGVLVGDAG